MSNIYVPSNSQLLAGSTFVFLVLFVSMGCKSVLFGELISINEKDMMVFVCE